MNRDLQQTTCHQYSNHHPLRSPPRILQNPSNDGANPFFSSNENRLPYGDIAQPPHLLHSGATPQHSLIAHLSSRVSIPHGGDSISSAAQFGFGTHNPHIINPALTHISVPLQRETWLHLPVPAPYYSAGIPHTFATNPGDTHSFGSGQHLVSHPTMNQVSSSPYPLSHDILNRSFSFHEFLSFFEFWSAHNSGGPNGAIVSQNNQVAQAILAPTPGGGIGVTPASVPATSFEAGFGLRSI